MASVTRATARYGGLPRASLTAMVLATPAGGACLIVAPAGYGRRTLLSRALPDGSPTLSLPSRRLTQPELREWRAQAAGLLRQPPDGASREWLVVLDLDPDLHPDVLHELAELARTCPAQHRIAVTSAEDLGGAFNSLRLSGRVAELDGDDLTLSTEESQSLLGQLSPSMGSGLTADVVALCAGWLAALVAAARYHERGATTETATWLRTHGAEQLLGPWFDSLPADVQELLLDTALLDQLHPSLVDAVAGGGGDRLADLACPGGPVRLARTPTDPEGPWFDRHPLLTTLLQFHAAGRPGDAERHRLAAQWYHQRQVLGRELVHLLVAGDAEAAASRFRRHEEELYTTGLAHMALRWYRTLPDAGHAEQLLREAWACAFSGRIPECRAALDRLQLALRAEPRDRPPTHPILDQLAAEADVLVAWLAEREGDLVQMHAAATRARAQFGGAWTRNSHQLAPLLLARAALHLGDLDEAERVLAGVRTEPFLTASLGEGRRAATEAELEWVCGEVFRTRTWAGRYHRWLSDQDPEHVRVRGGESPPGHLAHGEAGRWADAERGLEQAIRQAEQTANTTDEILARVALVTLLTTRHRLRAALNEAGTARAAVLARSPEGGLLALVSAVEIRARLVAGDALRAERLLRALPPSVDRQLLHLRMALQRGLPLAKTIAREIVPETPRHHAIHEVLTAWAVLADSRQRAEHHLMAAADIAVEHGLTTLLSDAPDAVVVMAKETAIHHVHDGLIGLVGTAEHLRGRAETGGAQSLSTPPHAMVMDVALTRGELQLLALLPTRLSNADIAAELAVSINTVKTRLRRLYSKLEVHDRNEAVARAAALGLIAARSHPGGSVVTPRG